MCLALQPNESNSEISSTGMIAIAEDIFEEIETEVVLLNGEVVRRAMSNVERFIAEERVDTCCDFLLNQEQFQILLDTYKLAKRVAISAWNRFRDPLAEEERGHDRDPCWRIRQNRFAYATECDLHRDELRARLRTIWPCLKCFDLHNPTGRKQSWLTKTPTMNW